MTGEISLPGRGTARFSQVWDAPPVIQIALTVEDAAPRSVNCYVIMRGADALLVDTGHGSETDRELLQAVWDDLGVSPESTALFVTHVHQDHAGQLGRMLPSDCARYLSRIDIGLLEELDAGAYERYIQCLVDEGLPPRYIQPLETVYVGAGKSFRDGLNIRAVENGDVLALGDLRFQVIGTPGHAPGHQGLWLPQAGLFFSGDHVLEQVTPHLGFWPGTTGALEAYLASLAALAELPVVACMPGHGAVMRGEIFRQRLHWLMMHHERRLEHIAAILNSYPEGLTCFQVLECLAWGAKRRTFSELRDIQVFLAHNMTLLYLENLVSKSMVARISDREMLRYVSARKSTNSPLRA